MGIRAHVSNGTTVREHGVSQGKLFLIKAAVSPNVLQHAAAALQPHTQQKTSACEGLTLPAMSASSVAPPSYGTTHPPSPRSSPKKLRTEDEDEEYVADIDDLPAGALPTPPTDKHHDLHRGLSARQVSMIAIAGTIGTGLFLGTGRSLASGGPASMLICYAIVGFIVWITLLLLGEMATQYPVAGESDASRGSCHAS